MLDSNSFEKLFTQGSVWLADKATADTEVWDSSIPIQKKNPASISISPEINSLLAHGGLKKAAFHEFFSRDKDFQVPLGILSVLTIRALCALKQLSGNYLFWIGKECWPSPHYLRSLSRSATLFDHCLFIDPEDEKQGLWAIEAALRSSSTVAVIAKLKRLSFVSSRRLALAAEKGNSIGLFVRDFKESKLPSAATTRWLIEPSASQISFNPRFQLRLLRQKGGPLPHINCILEILKDGTTISPFTLSDVVSGSCEEKATQPEQTRLSA